MSNGTARPRTTHCAKLCNEIWRLEGFSALALVSGEMQLTTCDGERVRLVEGDALLLGPGATCSARARITPCEVLSLDASTAWTEAMLHLSSDVPPARPATTAVLRAASPAARRVRQLLLELVLPHRPHEEPTALHRTRAMLELLGLAMEASASPLPASGPSRAGAASRKAFLAALAALQDAEDLDEIALRVLAERLQISERQVSRLFRVELDTTFCAFMTRLRVDRARRLLKDGELPVIQVAVETGWSSLAHFNSVFRRLTGRTPTAYRAFALRAQ